MQKRGVLEKKESLVSSCSAGRGEAKRWWWWCIVVV